MESGRMASLVATRRTRRMHGARFAGALLVPMLLAATSAMSADTSWTLRYVGRSTNEVIWDPKLDDTLHALLPGELLDLVKLNLGGPPGPVMGSGPDIALSACRSRDCADKAFLWIDTSSGTALGATAACPGVSTPPSADRWSRCALSLGSLAYTAETVPSPARRALLAWLTDENMEVTTVSFVGPDKVSRALDPAAYFVPVPYQPPPTGPSFSCAATLSPIERAICADPALSALDLELQSLYDQIRRGTSEEPAREELRDLEQGWLRTRDPACAATTGQTGCLARQYKLQIDTLEHWLPTARPRP